MQRFYFFFVYLSKKTYICILYQCKKKYIKQ